MNFVKASLSVLVVSVVFGSGCAMNEPARSAAADNGASEITANCGQATRRKVRGTYHPARRTYTTVRTDCNSR